MSQIDDKRRERAIQNRFNPIRGLKPERLAFILDNFRQGHLREAALLWDAMIRRDLLIRNVVSKRCKAVARAQWEILTVDDSAEALAQKRVLEKVYNNLAVTNALDQNERGGMGLLLRLMMTAQGFRYAVFDLAWKEKQGRGREVGSQKRSKGAIAAGRPARTAALAAPATEEADIADGIDNQSFLTAELTFCPLEFFECKTGRLRFLKQDFANESEEMKPGEWLVAVGDGIMEATSVAYMYKHMALKDWVACSEAFGTPIPWIKTDAAFDSAQWQQLEVMGSRMMAQQVLVTSNTDQVELIEMKGGTGSLPFPALVETMDRGIASIWRGADLSTISQGQAGIGASLQGEESDLLLEDDAKWLAEILWDQIDAPALRFALGVTEPLAYVSILPPKRKNVEQDLAIDRQLVQWSMPLSQDDAAERYGRSLAEPGDPLLAEAQPPTGTGPGSSADGGATRAGLRSGMENSETDRLRAAKRKLMAPILERLRRIDELEGEEKRNALLSLQAELPLLRGQFENAIGGSEVVDVLVEEMKRALVDGFEKGKKK